MEFGLPYALNYASVELVLYRQGEGIGFSSFNEVSDFVDKTKTEPFFMNTSFNTPFSNILLNTYGDKLKYIDEYFLQLHLLSRELSQIDLLPEERFENIKQTFLELSNGVSAYEDYYGLPRRFVA